MTTHRAPFGDSKGWRVATTSTLDKWFTEHANPTKLEAASQIRINGSIAWLVSRAVVFIRGKSGRERFTRLMVVDYLLSFLFLGGSAVLFWAIMCRAITCPNCVSWSESLQISAGHFLPGISVPQEPSIPLWCGYGAAITAWVLFVIYIGPAGSSLSSRQQAYVSVLKHRYQILRSHSVGLRKRMCVVRRLHDKQT